MNYLEKPLIFHCGGEELLGILAQPRHASDIGVVVVVGGPQYRAGSHRQFVLLARSLAAAGYPVLRFDFRGMGDSSGTPRRFDEVSQDIGAAIAALRAACPGVARIALWGLCDGASASLLYWHETRDPGLESLVLVNPWVRSEESLARTQVKHYYGRRLLQREFWQRLCSGELAIAASLRDFGRALGLSFGKAARPAAREEAFQARMAAAWRDFDGPLLLVLSGQDYVAREFLEYARSDPAWAGLLGRGNVERIDLPEADHTFSRDGQRRELERAVVDWLQRQEWPARRLARSA